MSLTNEQVEALKGEHEPAILAMLNGWRQALHAAGFGVSEPYEMHDPGYRWDLTVWRKEEDDFVDLSVRLVESRQWDDIADDGSSKGMTALSGSFERYR